MKRTKREAINRKAEWHKALVEGRVVRSFGGLSLTSYPTVEAARAAWLALVEDDDTAEIVMLSSEHAPHAPR